MFIGKIAEIILCPIGNMVRWAFRGFKGKLGDPFDDDDLHNFFTGFITLGLLPIVLYFINKYLFN